MRYIERVGFAACEAGNRDRRTLVGHTVLEQARAIAMKLVPEERKADGMFARTGRILLRKVRRQDSPA